MKDFAMGEVGLMPWDFLTMEWCDYQRHAQGYIIRQCRTLEAARKISYWQLIAAGAKNIRETQLFTLVTDPVKKKLPPQKAPTRDEMSAIAKRYFNIQTPE